ncbi:MarR family transcriptional regulator [uncultured Desulfobacter sp.]|uniref:MarR family winged helix-turn-helix transcriptional regulator n=1 Tax=uncultured Desulfobacter sp. TaxID=240139 RepID=UPI0029F55088|nr:MarR family transcriptional regulator [uncultured Desulfobacter sp.]
MKDNDTLSSARNILTLGRRVHDRVQQIVTAACMQSDGNGHFGELSAPQMNMIMMIRVRGEVSVTQLASLLSVSPPSVTAMVDRLVERGVLNRAHSRKDRRKVVISVPPEAIEEISRVEEKILQAFVELVEAVGPETTRMWQEVLQRVNKVMETDTWQSE